MVDIVIPVHGQFDLLEKCLNSIPDAFDGVQYRIYIHDNASPGEIEDIKTFYEKFPVRVSYGKNNVGFPRAVNIAASKGKNNLVFLLNSDVVLDPGSGKRLVEQFQDESVGVVGMKLLFADNRHNSKNQRNVEGKVQHVGLSFSITAQPHHIFLGWSPDNPRVNRIKDVPAVTGAAFMTRRSLWRKFNGLDVSFGFGTFEDVDFCFQTRKHGKRVIVDTDAIGYHYTNATAMEYGIGFNLEVNKRIFYNKWQGTEQLEWSDGYLL